VWKNNGLSLVPNINLISNIGFAKDALHTKDTKSISSNLATGKIKAKSTKIPVKRSIIDDNLEARFIHKINLANIFKEWLYYKFIK
jgi:hypothetical protein